MTQIASCVMQTVITKKIEDDSQDIVLRELVERARTGDDIAFADLYIHYQKSLWSLLNHIIGNNREVANDLYQDTFLSAWQMLPGLRPPFDFTAWLRRTAANKAIDFLRRNKKIQFVALPEYEVGAEACLIREVLSIEGHEDHICDLEWLKHVLDQMPHQQKVCLLLQEQWGFSQKEIAELLRISEKCVSAYISRGHQWLRKAREASSTDTPTIHIRQKGGKV